MAEGTGTGTAPDTRGYTRAIPYFKVQISHKKVHLKSNQTKQSQCSNSNSRHHVELRDVPTACIWPYRILEDNIEEYLVKTDEGKPLNGRQTVSDCFADIPVIQTYCVVIQLPMPTVSDRLASLESG